MTQNNSENKARMVYFSHGGGPLPILGDPGHQAMVDFMRQLPSQFGKPDAILVISAHWEERAATLISAEHPAMFYDYYGFPAEAYDLNFARNSAHRQIVTVAISARNSAYLQISSHARSKNHHPKCSMVSFVNWYPLRFISHRSSAAIH